MSDRNRKWVHPNAISYETEGVDRPLHYFRHWEHFTLTFEDFHFRRAFSSQEIDMELEDREFERVATKMSEQGFAALDKEEQDKFRWHQLSYIKPVKEAESIALSGWARFEGGIGDERITSFTVANDPLARRRDKDLEYERTFHRVKVDVVSRSEDAHGSMFIQDQDMRTYGTDPDEPDEDFLYAQFHMALPKLKLLANEVAKLPRKPVMVLRAQGLLFRDEVDFALSEVWHPRDYAMIYGHMTPVILKSLTFRLLDNPPAAADEDLTELQAAAASSWTAPAKKTTPASKAGAVAKQVKGLKHALWLLAAAVVLAALVN